MFRDKGKSNKNINWIDTTTDIVIFLFYMILGIFIGNYIRIKAFAVEGGAFSNLLHIVLLKG